MKLIKITLLIIAILINPSIYGCGKKEDRDIEAIKKAILMYDNSLISVYRELNTKPISGLASEKEIGRIRMIILKFIQEKTFMESELKEVRFMKIDKKGSAAEVETFERWRYRHLKEGTKEEALPWKDEEYRLLYTMARSKDKWIMVSSKFMK